MADSGNNGNTTEQVQKPLNEFQRRVLVIHADAMTRILAQNRKVLTSDELHEAKKIVPNFECGDDVLGVYFYSINCMVNGTTYAGALFANELCMVYASNQNAATKLAYEGMEDTIHALNLELYTRGIRTEPDDDAFTLDMGGRKNKITREIQLQPTLVRMLDNKLNKLKH